jgi:hypothetical protein
MAGIRIPPTFRAGTRVEVSGHYRVFHQRNHSVVLDVLCIAGETFPECRTCGSKANFTLHRDIPHVRECALFDSNAQSS